MGDRVRKTATRSGNTSGARKRRLEAEKKGGNGKLEEKRKSGSEKSEVREKVCESAGVGLLEERPCLQGPSGRTPKRGGGAPRGFQQSGGNHH